MADLKFFKVDVDVLEDPKIKLMMAGEGGDTRFTIFVGLLSQAMKACSGGYLMIDDDFPHTRETLATVMNRSTETMTNTVDSLLRFKILSHDEEADALYFSAWDKNQSEDRLEAIRDRDRKRKAEARERQKSKAPRKSMERPRSVHGASMEVPPAEVEVELELEEPNNHCLPKGPDGVIEGQIGLVENQPGDTEPHTGLLNEKKDCDISGAAAIPTKTTEPAGTNETQEVCASGIYECDAAWIDVQFEAWWLQWRTTAKSGDDKQAAGQAYRRNLGSLKNDPSRKERAALLLQNLANQVAFRSKHEPSTMFVPAWKQAQGWLNYEGTPISGAKVKLWAREDPNGWQWRQGCEPKQSPETQQPHNPNIEPSKRPERAPVVLPNC